MDKIHHIAVQVENLSESLEWYEKEFDITNHQLTKKICQVVESLNKNIPIIFSSSTQAHEENLYGKSKLAAEAVLL